MNTRDKAKGLCVTSERHIGTLGVRCREALRRVARCMGEAFAPLHYLLSYFYGEQNLSFMKCRYNRFFIGAIVLVVVGFLTGCAMRVPTVQVNKDLRTYSYVYIPATQPVQETLEQKIESVNPRDLIAGAFAKKGFIILPSVDERFRAKTLMVGYGQGRGRSVTLREVTIQLVSAETGELVATVTSEGLGVTEVDKVEAAITRALKALLK